MSIEVKPIEADDFLVKVAAATSTEVLNLASPSRSSGFHRHSKHSFGFLAAQVFNFQHKTS